MTVENIAVSVVVPTCGRAELLMRCLQALAVQTLPASRYEVIVVDDRPTPATQSLVEAWAERVPRPGLAIRYLANYGRHGPAAARNLGWRTAHAPIVAFTDDDTVPAPDWLESGLSEFDGKADAVCGRIEMPIPPAPTDYERDARHLETAEFVTANFFCRKDLLALLDGFDERFRFAWREDSDLHFRLLRRRARIVHAPRALVVHPVRPAPWGVSISQQKKILFDALLYKKHPRLYREKIRATPRWDYYAIVAALLAVILGLAVDSAFLALGAGAMWLAMTARFCLARLRGTTKTASHVVEMVLTSIVIPPYAVFWRMVGAMRFRVRFL